MTDGEKALDAILAWANTSESGIGGTSPVAMYPLGESNRHGLRDVAGNAWERTGPWYDKAQSDRVVQGWSWRNYQWLARPDGRSRNNPGN